ncbi:MULTISPECIES: hypothetical protein [unclassified Bradyrhizobium]
MEALELDRGMAQAERATRPKRWRHTFSMRERRRKKYAANDLQLLVAAFGRSKRRGFAIASVRAR